MIVRYSGPAGPACTRHSLNAGVGMTIFSPASDSWSIRYSTRSFARGTDDGAFSLNRNSRMEASNTTISVQLVPVAAEFRQFGQRIGHVSPAAAVHRA